MANTHPSSAEICISALKTVKNFYAAIAQGDVPGVLAVLHPDLAWTKAEGFPY